MASKVFMTGFPGFIAQRLVDRLLARDPEATFIFLIEDRMRGVADATIKGMEKPHPGFIESTEVLTGDISKPLLGLSPEEYRELCRKATHVWHLAAIYDLSVPQARAYRVNVVGTANILDLCEACEALVRLDYVSTCYVAGDRTGPVLESELDCGQGFKNHYESTKCWAEMEVRRRMDRIPTAVHRPSVVLGDSRTGETDKYDGPYFLINLLAKLPTFLPMVHIGPSKAAVNLVPVDFLVEAMAEIGQRNEALGLTIHLADPMPHQAREIMESLLSIMGFGKPLATVPTQVVEEMLGIKLVRDLVKIPQELVTYFNHAVSFDTQNQRKLLEGSGIACPDLLSYLPTLIEYVRKHPDKPFLDGRGL